MILYCILEVNYLETYSGIFTPDFGCSLQCFSDRDTAHRYAKTLKINEFYICKVCHVNNRLLYIWDEDLKDGRGRWKQWGNEIKEELFPHLKYLVISYDAVKNDYKSDLEQFDQLYHAINHAIQQKIQQPIVAYLTTGGREKYIENNMVKYRDLQKILRCYHLDVVDDKVNLHRKVEKKIDLKYG